MKKEDIERGVAELQILEQSLQNFSMQKQTFQAQLMEVENALEELKAPKGETYKIVGSIMIAANKDDLNKDLNYKREILGLRVKNLEKQEVALSEKAKKIQEELMLNLKKRKNEQ